MYLYHRFGITSPFDAAHKHVTSPVFSVPVLAGVRLLIAVYTLVTLLFTLIWDNVRDHDGGAFFSYFTNLSYIGLSAYFFASGVQTIAFARTLRPADGGAESVSVSTTTTVSYPLQKWPRPLQFLHLLLEITITTFPILVTIVFWALLADPAIFNQTITAWSNISIHILNSAFALVEIFFTNIPPAPWLMLPCGFFLLACYLAVAYITHETQGFYAYNFLDPQTQGAFLAAYIVGIAVGYCLVFVIIRFVILLRVRVVAWGGVAKRRGEYVMSDEAMDEWTEVERPSSKEVGVAV